MMSNYEFCGVSPRVAKRRALNYWYVNRGRLGLTMSQFFGRCRLSQTDGTTTITFYPEPEAEPATA